MYASESKLFGALTSVTILLLSFSIYLNQGGIGEGRLNVTRAWAQPADQTNSTQTGNSTGDKPPLDTFLAEGSINQLIPLATSTSESATQASSESLFLLGGNWMFAVKDGQVDEFSVHIKMVSEDGTQMHYHSILNLSNVTSRLSPIGNTDEGFQNNISFGEAENGTLSLSGFADITTNGVIEWQDVAVTIVINNGRVISIIPNPGEVNHFYGLPVYGLVDSISGQSGEQLGITPDSGNATTFHGKGTVSLYDEREPAGTDVAEDEESQNQPQPTLRIPYPDEAQRGYAFLDSPETDRPLIAKKSANENYLVQLRWSQSEILPLPGLNYQLFFLNPALPNATFAIVPEWISNQTGATKDRPADFVDPDVLLYFEPADSYDITVYSDAGNVLWQKDNAPIFGGRSQGLITLENDYRGPITIEITDIQPHDGAEPSSGGGPPLSDSVTFNSLIVE